MKNERQNQRRLRKGSLALVTTNDYNLNSEREYVLTYVIGKVERKRTDSPPCKVLVISFSQYHGYTLEIGSREVKVERIRIKQNYDSRLRTYGSPFYDFHVVNPSRLIEGKEAIIKELQKTGLGLLANEFRQKGLLYGLERYVGREVERWKK